MCCGIEGGTGWWMLFGGLGMLLFWGTVIGLVVWGIRSTFGQKGSPSESVRPIEIAERRYVQGEITLQEFEDIKTGLEPRNRGGVGDTSQRASRL